ncbi:MAG: HD-GYP domain-containing protein [Thiomonas sp.]|jgi:hypothetical protein
MQQQGDDEQTRAGLPRQEGALTWRSGWFARWLGPRTRPRSDETADHLLVSLLNMASFVEARDPYTGGHLWRVSRYARLLAAAAGLDAVEVARVSLGGFLHDLGKIGVPDAILCKSAPLTDAEWAVMRPIRTSGCVCSRCIPTPVSERASFQPGEALGLPQAWPLTYAEEALLYE